MQAHRIHESVVGLLSKALERNTEIPRSCRFCLEPVSFRISNRDDLRRDYLEHTAAHFAELADRYVPLMKEFEVLTHHTLAEQPLALWERASPTFTSSESDRLRQWIHTYVDPLIRAAGDQSDEEDDRPPTKTRTLVPGLGIRFTKEPEALSHGWGESSDRLPIRSPRLGSAA
jgi:hypothetical protein